MPSRAFSVRSTSKRQSALLFRYLAGFFLVVTLVFGWLAYGSYLLAVVSYAVPSLNLSLGTFSLPTVQAADGIEPVTLRIPKIGVSAPVIRDVPVDDQPAYDAALEQGVALARGTAPLEATDGNSFVFGHSSRFAIKKTPYDAIFALLPQLASGDTVELDAGDQKATYTVKVSKVISPTDVQYMDNTQGRYLTMVTCWPAGTNLKRWVVQAVRTN